MGHTQLPEPSAASVLLGAHVQGALCPLGQPSLPALCPSSSEHLQACAGSFRLGDAGAGQVLSYALEGHDLGVGEARKETDLPTLFSCLSTGDKFLSEMYVEHLTRCWAHVLESGQGR